MFKRIALSAALAAALLAGCSPPQTPPTVTPTMVGVSTPDSSPSSPSPDDHSRCGIFKTGSNVRVVVSPGNDTLCQDLAKSLSRDGSFWTVRNQPVDDGQLTLVCAMQKDGYLAYVEDTGGQIYGQGLCSEFLTATWTEDTGVEDQVAAQASSATRAQASTAASAAAANKLAMDQAAAAKLVASIQTDIQPLAKDLSGMDSDVSKENDDLAGLKKDAAGGTGTSCDNVQTVNYDATQNVGYHISALRQDVSALHNAVQQVRDDGGPATDGADSAIASANSAITDAITHANADIDQANSMASAGIQIANKLATGNCSGNGPGSYQPVPHIS